MKLLLILLVLLLVATTATAEVTLEVAATQDTTMSLNTGYFTKGPKAADIAVDGDGSITFIWFVPSSREVIDRTQMYFLRAEYPPRHLVFSDGPDSTTLDSVTWAEAIVSFSW